jgi:hypothetical protein
MSTHLEPSAFYLVDSVSFGMISSDLTPKYFDEE